MSNSHAYAPLEQVWALQELDTGVGACCEGIERDCDGAQCMPVPANPHRCRLVAISSCTQSLYFQAGYIMDALTLCQVAAIDADAHKDAMSEYGVRGFPTIKLIAKKPNGKLRSVDYKAREMFLPLSTGSMRARVDSCTEHC